MAHEPLRTERRVLPGAVRRIRTLSRKTQAEIATAGRFDFTTMSHIEKGRQPSLDVMCRLAEALAVDLDDISYVATIYVADAEPEPESVGVA